VKTIKSPSSHPIIVLEYTYTKDSTAQSRHQYFDKIKHIHRMLTSLGQILASHVRNTLIMINKAYKDETSSIKKIRHWAQNIQAINRRRTADDDRYLFSVWY